MADALEADQREESPDKTTFWKGFQPMTFSLDDFIQYLAGPFVTNLLISEDHQITEPEAEVIRQESAKYGRTAHNTSESIDDLVMTIAAPQRVSRRVSFCQSLTVTCDSNQALSKIGQLNFLTLRCIRKPIHLLYLDGLLVSRWLCVLQLSILLLNPVC
jgi:hypothetical protein